MGIAAGGVIVALGWFFTGMGATSRHSAESNEVLGWVAIILGGLYGLAWLASFLKPHWLVIEEGGFRYKNALSKTKHLRWDDLEEIWVFSRHGSGIVVWKNKHATGSITRALFGYDGWLPGLWEVSAYELAGELRTEKEKHYGRQSAD